MFSTTVACGSRERVVEDLEVHDRGVGDHEGRGTDQFERDSTSRVPDQSPDDTRRGKDPGRRRGTRLVPQIRSGGRRRREGIDDVGELADAAAGSRR